MSMLETFIHKFQQYEEFEALLLAFSLLEKWLPALFHKINVAKDYEYAYRLVV